ncbi:hypothetical protein ACMFMG_011078 [Clarireedia jacksonii]
MDFEVWSSQNLLGRGRAQSFFQARPERGQSHRAQSVFPSRREGFTTNHSVNFERSSRPRALIPDIILSDDSDEESSGTEEYHTPTQGGSNKRAGSLSHFTPTAAKRHQSERPTRRFATPTKDANRQSFLDDNTSNKTHAWTRGQYALDGGAHKSSANMTYTTQQKIDQDKHLNVAHKKSSTRSNILTSQSPHNLQSANQTPDPRNAVKHSRVSSAYETDSAISTESFMQPHASNREDPRSFAYQRVIESNQASWGSCGKSVAPAMSSGVSDKRSLKRQASSQLLASPLEKIQLEQPLWPNRATSDSSPPGLHDLPQVKRRILVEHGANSYKNAGLTKPNTKSPRGESTAPITSRSRPIAQTPQQIDLSDDDVDSTWEASYRKSRKSQLKVVSSPYHIAEVLPTKSAFARKKSAKNNFDAPSSRSRDSINIDLDTPEIEKGNKPRRQFFPSNNWIPRGRIFDRSELTTLKSISQAGISNNDTSQLNRDIQRQKQAAELIVTKEFEVQFEEAQQAIFGEVLPETEKDKQNREQAQRIEKQKARELEEKKRVAEEELKKKRENERAARMLEKKAAEKLDKERREIERKARLAKERERQAQVELDLAKKRREDEELRKQKAAVALKEKEEREKKQAAEKRKEEEILRLKLEVQQRDKLLAAQSAQSLVPAKLHRAKNVQPLKAAAAAPSLNVPNDSDELFVSDVQGEPRASPHAMPSSTFSDLDDLFGEADDADEDEYSFPDAPAAEASEDACINVPENEGTNLPKKPQKDDRLISNAQGPPSAAEALLRPNDRPQKDMEAEREANRSENIQEPAAQFQLAREKPASVATDPKFRIEMGPNNPSSKPEKRSAPMKATVKATQNSGDNPMASIFGTKLVPLHPVESQLHLNISPQNYCLGQGTVPMTSGSLLNPVFQRSTDMIKKPETVLISTTQAIELEERRARIEAEAQANKNFSKSKRDEASRKQRYLKNTAALRKKHEALFKEKAVKEGKSLTAKELQDEVDKFIAKRDRENERRWKQRRGIEPTSTLITRNISSPAQESQSPSVATPLSQIEEESPEAIARKEREAEATALLESMQKESVYSNRFSQTASRHGLQRVVLDCESDSDSDGSEEDPDDDEVLADMRAQLSAKQSTCNDTPELSWNLDGGNLGEKSSGKKSFVPLLRSDDSSAHTSQSLLDGISSSGDTVMQESVNDIGFPAPQFQIPYHPTPQIRASDPPEYKMVNVFNVMWQELIKDYGDIPKVLKSFPNVEEANEYAQSLVNRHRNQKEGRIAISEKWDPDSEKYSADIAHNKSKTTKYYIMTKSLRPEDIENYDPTKIKPKVANKLWIIKYTTIAKENDPLTNTTKETKTVTLPLKKVYTVLNMANHDACEYFLEQVKPKAEQDESDHVEYEEQTVPLARSGRDMFNDESDPFDIEADTSCSSWIGYDWIQVEVEQLETTGPIN